MPSFVQESSQLSGLFTTGAEDYFSKLAKENVNKVAESTINRYGEEGLLYWSSQQVSFRNQVRFYTKPILLAYMAKAYELKVPFTTANQNVFLNSIAPELKVDRNLTQQILFEMYKLYRDGKLNADLYNPNQSAVDLDERSLTSKALSAVGEGISTIGDKLWAGLVIVGVAYVAVKGIPGIILATARR